MKQTILLTAGVITIVFTVLLGMTVLEVRYLKVQRDYQRLKDSFSHFFQEYAQLKEELGNSKSSNFRLVSNLTKEETFRILDVEMTAYEPVESQTDDTPYVVASGKRITEKEIKGLNIVAISRDLLQKFDPEAPLKLGDTIWISVIIEDVMHERFTNSVDLLMEEGRAKNFGRQQRSIVYIDR